MATIVTQSKPVKHGKRTHGKQVIASSPNRHERLPGVYHYDAKLDRQGLFGLETASGHWCLVKKLWDIEELITKIE